ncbi:lysyl oxidase family protein [Actinomycetes bacterium KLBMP 9797]
MKSAIVIAAVAALNLGTATAAAAAPPPPLRLVAASETVTVYRYGEELVYPQYGTHMVAGRKPFEVWAKRTSYTEPITAYQVVRDANGKREVPLPAGLVRDFTGLSNFLHVTITDQAGGVVVERDESFCPSAIARTRPDAPDTSPYADGCAYNPFTIGAVWGIQAGWSSYTGGYGEGVDLADGTYRAHIQVNQPYLDLFGIPADQASATVTLEVRPYEEGEGRDQRAAGGTALRPAASEPTGPAVVPTGPKPDLQSLPAWGIEIGGYEPEPDDRDYLSFNATVWVGGRSPLVVDGFRRADEDVMDAYQYFYDAQGNQTGYAPVGTMEWDAREGHHHWHFTDFAQYRLLNEDASLAVRSGKEAFCLAATDAVDYTLPRANWQPRNTDLHTSCGYADSLAVREVLDVGSGDTYAQYLPGQNFDITDLPNGTYYVEVVANPDGNLYESNRKNNTSLRKVILGGEPGARTVEVPPVGIITG